MDEDPAMPDPQPPERWLVSLFGHITPRSGKSFAEVIAKSDERFAAMQRRAATTDRSSTALQREMRRALALAVWEVDDERRKHREIEENITRLSAAQLVTEEKFQGLLDALRRGENGHQ
jgi:hypothetical protein